MNREILLENYQNPSNFEEVKDDSYIKVNSNNENCIDNIDIYYQLEDNLIKDLKFQGEACAITIASSSIMTKLLKDKTIEEAKDIINNFEKMINNEPYNEELLEDANCFNEIYKQENRKICALLPYNGIKKQL